jgi:hypothetical protein
MQLTIEIERLIVASIRAGGYPHMAAEAAGVPRLLFERWLRRGRRSSAEPYHRFRQSVMQAKAHVRVTAEWEIRRDDPKNWLQLGPGKESAEAPGWSTKPPLEQPQDEAAVLALMAEVADALVPFPEARQAVMTKVENSGLKKRRRRPIDLPRLRPPDNFAH